MTGSGRINVRYGYFIKDKLLLGPDLNYGFIGTYYQSGEAGPFIRYYLINRSFSPILEGGYHYRWTRLSSISSTFSYVNHDINGNVGFAITGLVNNQFGLETLLNYQMAFDKFGYTYYKWGFTFSVTYHFK